MDLKNINPSAYSDQEQFPLGGGEFLRIPTVAKAQSITAASRKLQRGLELYDGVTLKVPAAEASAIAAAVVDPTQLRNDIERKRVSMHRTPSGFTLISLEARVWAAAVSCDGANGRGRLEVKLAGGTVWPVPEADTAEPSMRYVTRDVSRMRQAVRDNAKRIGSPDMRQSLRDHPHGVWNPIYLVPGEIIEQRYPKEEAEASGFVHTAEGSTRVVTCQEGLGIDVDEAVAYAGSTIDLVRRVRAGVANRISQTPGSADVRHAVKVLTLPAHIIVGVLDGEHQVSQVPFPEVVSEFVQSIHEQPRPWNVLAQGGVRGERLVAELIEARRLTEEQGNDVVRRDEHLDVTTAPNVIAGRLLRAASHPDVYDIVRKAILEDPKRQQLTRKRYAQTVGPLLLAIYDRDHRQKTAAAALTNEFQPEALRRKDWSTREDVDIPDLLEEALSALDARPGELSSPALELIARGVVAITALGLVLSDQGSAVNERAWLRGSVAKVIQGLATCAGGVKMIAEAIEHIEGRQEQPPMLYDADGNPDLVDGEAFRLVAQGGANIRLRSLAFRAQRPIGDDEDAELELGAYDQFIAIQRQVVAKFAELDELMNRAYDVRDESDDTLIDKHGLRRDLLGELPRKLSDLRDNILLGLEAEPEALEDSDDEMDALAALEDAMDGDDAELDEAA